MIVTPRCKPDHKDAISALKRAKSPYCLNKLHEIVCLVQKGKLYWNNITRYCHVDRSKGRPSHPIEAKVGYGPPIRILYAMVVHGRAWRQVKRLFKALFHTDHYFYFHVDSVRYVLHVLKFCSSTLYDIAINIKSNSIIENNFYHLPTVLTHKKTATQKINN